MGYYRSSGCTSPVDTSQMRSQKSGVPDLMRRSAKCSRSLPKEMAESAQSYLHPGSSKWAPDWKIPLPPIETWLNHFPDHVWAAWEPRLAHRWCLPGSCRGFPNLLNPPNAVTHFFGPARLWSESTQYHLHLGLLLNVEFLACYWLDHENTKHTMQSAVYLSARLAWGRTLPKASILGLHIN